MSTKRCLYCAEEIQEAAVKCRYCGSWLEVHPEARFASSGPPKRLMRSVSDRYFAGICGGIGDYLNVDATIIRLLAVIAIVCTAIIPGLLVYLVCSFVIPAVPKN